jgi:glycosyltransferase involved in cell wall biosynthesis
MNTLDVHVLSSSTEAFPNVLAEAMACGTPCVTTDVGDAALIVDDTGWVVEPKNPCALADGLKQALDSMTDRVDWLKRQSRCRERIVNNFSIEQMVKAYRQVWHQADPIARFT